MTYTDYTAQPEREIFTFVEKYEQSEIWQSTKDGQYCLGSEKDKRFPKKYATVILARTAVTKRFTAINNVYARNYVKHG